MSAEPNTPRVMSATEVRKNFSEVVNSVARGEGRVIVEKSGTPAAVVIPIDDYRQLQRNDELARRREWLASMREMFRDIPPDELQQEIEKSIAEVKEDMRRERVEQGAAATRSVVGE